MENKLITVSPIDVSQAEDFRIEATNINTRATSIIISSQLEYDNASDFLRKIKARYVEIDSLRKSITQPLDLAKRNIMDIFRAPLTLLEQAEGVIKKSILVYMDKEESIRKAQEEKLRIQAEKARQEALAKAEAARQAGKEEKAEKYEEKANNIVAPILAPTIEQAKGQAVKMVWSAKVVDFAKLPDEYKLPNMPMLNRHAQNTKGQIPIHGITFISEKILASRS